VIGLPVLGEYMPLPLLPLIGAFLLGKDAEKSKKKEVVSKYKTKTGKTVKAHTRKPKEKSFWSRTS
jgi:hypothetical protein